MTKEELIVREFKEGKSLEDILEKYGEYGIVVVKAAMKKELGVTILPNPNDTITWVDILKIT